MDRLYCLLKLQSLGGTDLVDSWMGGGGFHLPFRNYYEGDYFSFVCWAEGLESYSWKNLDLQTQKTSRKPFEGNP